MSHLNGSEPAAPPAYSALKTAFASLAFRESDTIDILQLPQKDIDGLREVIKQSWAKGIQKELLLYSSCHEFKLRGNPWNSSSWTNNECIPSRILTQEIFAYLYSAGWTLHGNNDEFFIFRQQQTSPPECDWISITRHRVDRLRLVGASTELIASFRDMLKNMELLQDECWLEKENDAWEFKMKGRPWVFQGENMVKGCLLLLKIVDTLEMHGWNIYLDTRLHMPTQSGVFTISNGWFCKKDKHWVPGMTTVRA
ncbi:hypothetical protein N431DRAFT_376444 [Stipitochalara longipes BDJ]|nr:hypothetical protein N431DRAFT_376444 [Stipitochalara longipes BDJ]